MLRIERELGMAHEVAPVGVREERLRPVRDPLDRAAEIAGRDRREDVLGIDGVLSSESAADVVHEHPEPLLPEAEDLRELPPHPVRHLGRDVQGPALPVVLDDHPAGLQGTELGPVVDDAPPDDPVGGRERGFGRRPIADLPAEGHVVGDVVPDRRPLGGFVAGGDGGEGIVVDVDALARVERLRAVSATTKATHSPTKRTRSLTRTGWWRLRKRSPS